ncbi:MAG: hypothetical protein ACKPJD_31270, partial [Planctomycetaceae bacterium]
AVLPVLSLSDVASDRSVDTGANLQKITRISGNLTASDLTWQAVADAFSGVWQRESTGFLAVGSGIAA